MYSTWMNKHVINAKEMLKTGHCDGFALPALKLLQLKKHGFDTNTETMEGNKERDPSKFGNNV